MQRLNAAEERQDVVFAASEVTFDEVEAADGSKTPSANIIAYTGGRLSLGNFPHPVVINLEGVQAMSRDQLPFLRDHDQAKAVGHGTPKIEASQLRHEGSLSVPGTERDAIVAASKNDFSWQASVGGRIPNRRKNVQTIASGDRVRVNGRSFDGPLSVVNAFLWKETSFVAVGADEGRASASVAAASPIGVTPMNDFDKWLEAAGVDSAALTAEQLNTLKAAFTAQATVEASDESSEPIAASVETPVDIAGIVKAATAAAVEATKEQSQRERRVDRLFASHSDVDSTDIRAQLDSGEISEDKAHLELVLASRGRGGTSNVHRGQSSMGDNYPMMLEAGVARTAGFAEEDIHEVLVEAGASKDQAEEAVTRSNRQHKGMKSIILAICRQEGHHADEVDDDAIRCAMNASKRDSDIQAASGFSTVVLPGILSRLANKAMLSAYAEADNGGVATRISSTTSTRDFKKFSRYRMTESGVMEQVSAAGQIPQGTVTEESYENQVQTYGKIISLTRQMMRNDDMDAFLQIPRMIGRMGRHALEQAVITTLVDAPVAAGAGTTEFFHGAARGNQEPNYLVGATTNLSLTALDAPYELFLNQVDADGKPIMIDPAILLCTNGDAVQAAKLYNDTEYRFTTATTAETINNQWQGMFTPLKSSYLHRLGTTPSSTAWYLLANPSLDVSAIQTAFLDGVQTPTISSAETTFDTLGMQMRGVFDFGTALQDPRAIVKVKGAA